MKCVIFGGGGFIGSTIADRLLLEGHELRIFERPRVEPYRKFADNEAVEWMTGDILSNHDLNAAIEGMDVVLHLVSTTLPKSSNDDPIYDVQSNVVGTLQMLNAMVANKVQKIIFISSGGTVYGIPKYLPIDEQHPTDPLVSYGITKLMIEKYLRMFESLHGIQSIALRVANPYGERQRIETAQGAVGVFLHHALKDIPIEIWGDGSVTRDYIHISDVAEAFVKAVNYTGSHSVFNISSGQGISLNELIVLLENVLGKSIACRYLPARPFDVPVSVLCNQLAQEQLQWTPLTSMTNGLIRTAAWMESELAKS
ncbi:MAG: NAD-dependent epimerase/dehydratase family protein [Methylococcaceae bacterium]|nr:NAD-dependent epimerase/dehydratase family protein [Methylococcaceae bacterium]MDD1614948.1 NAD-dependent epimerase/dehydratase family protein [Methylococcaceae bacterium]OYV21540.1 MAG: UDP-glucose 4-epimerase [Methylococcaceae bacterium NSP1-2]